MGLLEQLQEQGWYITQPGLEKLLEGDKNGPTNTDVKQVVKLALNTDIRDYGGGTLSSLTTRGTKVDSFDGFGVVQIVKLRNLGAPKVNEESKTAPRLLKLTITDGQTQYVALEHEHIPALSINTPPGTKILLKSGPIRIAQGVLMLSDKNVSVLGGHVTALVEKWELSRTMAKYAKGGRLQFSTSGPPPWIPFGQKIQQPTAVNSDKDFKSLQTKEKDESKENSEFNALRNDAIAEATKLGTKKTFGGGAKQMVDANVQKIMDKGFSEEQANNALKLTRNNVDRALSNLQRIEYRRQSNAEASSGGPPSAKPDSIRTGGKRGFSKRDDESELQAKPLGKVSLFDYFGDILQDGETAAAGNSSAGKKASKESTPNDRNSAHRPRSGSAGRVEGNRSANNNRSQHHGSQNHGSSNGGNHHSSIGGASRQNSDGNCNYAGGVLNGAAAKSYSQRFENNISSSFANRNTSTAPPGGGSGRDRGRDQGHYSGQSQRESQSSYKQSDYYGSSGNNSRYSRGANDNHSSTNQSTGASTSGRSGGEGGGRGSRGNDSKYNQQQSSTTSGFSNSHQRAERSDSYRSNSTTPSSNNNNATGGGKHAGANGKGPSNNSSGHGNSYGSEGRNHQQQQSGNESRSQTGGSGSGKTGGGASAGSNHHHGSSQQQQSSYGNGPKQANYNQQQGSGSSSHNSNTNATSNTNSQGHYSQQSHSASNNSYGGGGNSTSKNSNKNNRYGGKDESHKYSDGSAASNAASSGPSQNKKLSTKGHGSQAPAGSDHRSNQQQSSYGPSSGGTKHTSQGASANSKVNHLSEQMGSMQLADGKSAGYGGPASSNTSNTATGSAAASSAASHPTSSKSGAMKQVVPNHPSSVVQQQQHVPQVASPPGASGMPPSGRGGPSPGAINPGVNVAVTGTGMPKNFIQLPNGYNYNPYQILGFQNKQANEFAMNVLKSQQHFDPMQQPAQHLRAPPSGSATVSPVGPGVALPMAATGAPSGVIPSPTTVLGGGPSPGPIATPGPMTAPGLAMAQALAPATMAVAYPNWKIGDHCLAKYWEDGGFYTAEITDTSESTFVVHFLEYGNYEEVLKKDCIPISPAGTGAAPPGPLTLSYHPAPASAHMPPPPQPATVPGPPVQYVPHPHHAAHPHGHAHHHHGHVPPHHAPPPMGGAHAHGPYQTASLPEVIGHANAQPPPSHYAPFKPGPPQLAQAMASQGQTVLAPAMGQYQQHTPLHLHQQQQQQQAPGHLPQHHHHHHHQQQMQGPPHAQQQRPGGKFREQRPMYVPPAQRK